MQGCTLPLPIETLMGRIQNSVVAVGKYMLRDQAEIVHRQFTLCTCDNMWVEMLFVGRRLLRIDFDFCVAVLSIINPIV